MTLDELIEHLQAIKAEADSSVSVYVHDEKHYRRVEGVRLVYTEENAFEPVVIIAVA